MTTRPPRTGRASHFLTLPPELRLQILHTLFDGVLLSSKCPFSHGRIIQGWRSTEITFWLELCETASNDTLSFWQRDVKAILYTCRSIRQECLLILQEKPAVMYHGDFSRRMALRERYRQAHFVGIRAMSAFIRHLTFENYKQIGNYVSMCEIKDINVSGCHLLKTLSASIWVRDLGELRIGLASDCTDVPEIGRAVQARWVDDPSRCFGIARRVTSVACTLSPSHGPGGRMILRLNFTLEQTRTR